MIFRLNVSDCDPYPTTNGAPRDFSQHLSITTSKKVAQKTADSKHDCWHCPRYWVSTPLPEKKVSVSLLKLSPNMHNLQQAQPRYHLQIII